jgi:hypothetical protein
MVIGGFGQLRTAFVPAIESLPNALRAQARRQGLDYACQTGARFIVITDADRYEIYDHHRGWDFDSMYCGRFQPTQFYAASAAVLDLLRYQN